MQAIILAGGMGSRLKPITDYVPKPLIPINNIPLIEWQIKYLKKFDFNDFIICTGYKTEQIQNYLELKRNFGVTIKYSIEDSPLGTGGAIKKASKLVNAKSFLVINGDVITTIDIRKILAHENSVALVELRTKFGTVDLDGNIITRFKEKTTIPDVWMNAGIYHLEKNIAPRLPTNGAIEETTFHEYALKRKLFAVRFKNAFWYSIDSHRDLTECSNAMSNS